MPKKLLIAAVCIRICSCTQTPVPEVQLTLDFGVTIYQCRKDECYLLQHLTIRNQIMYCQLEEWLIWEYFSMQGLLLHATYIYYRKKFEDGCSYWQLVLWSAISSMVYTVSYVTMIKLLLLWCTCAVQVSKEELSSSGSGSTSIWTSSRPLSRDNGQKGKSTHIHH